MIDKSAPSSLHTHTGLTCLATTHLPSQLGHATPKGPIADSRAVSASLGRGVPVGGCCYVLSLRAPISLLKGSLPVDDGIFFTCACSYKRIALPQCERVLT